MRLLGSLMVVVGTALLIWQCLRWPSSYPIVAWGALLALAGALIAQGQEG